MHPRDAYAHCMRCGAPPTPQPDNSSRCEACGFRWYWNAAAAVDVIVENGRGEIVITRRAIEPGKGTLDLPGGFVQPDESVEEAARRELAEELGLSVGPLAYVTSFPNRYPYGGMIYFALDLFFTARVSNDAPLHPGDDVGEARFVDPRAVDAADFGLESTRRGFEAFRAMRR